MPEIIFGNASRKGKLKQIRQVYTCTHCYKEVLSPWAESSDKCYPPNGWEHLGKCMDDWKCDVCIAVTFSDAIFQVWDGKV